MVGHRTGEGESGFRHIEAIHLVVRIPCSSATGEAASIGDISLVGS